MEISERQQSILDKIVREYINSAQPVSSQLLEKKYNFGICPAMIRIEMEKLTETDFVKQPFVSAGRIPTDKGYRFFVDRLLKREIPEHKDADEIEKIIKKERRDAFRFTSRIIKLLAHSSSAVILLHLLDQNLSLKEGLEGAAKEPEFEDRDLFFNFTEFLDDLEENIKELDVGPEIKIYIGKENPLEGAKDFSLISSKCYLPEEEKGIIVIAGPKRMFYDKNISLINSFIKSMEEFNI